MEHEVSIPIVSFLNVWSKFVLFSKRIVCLLTDRKFPSLQNNWFLNLTSKTLILGTGIMMFGNVIVCLSLQRGGAPWSPSARALCPDPWGPHLPRRGRTLSLTLLLIVNHLWIPRWVSGAILSPPSPFNYRARTPAPQHSAVPGTSTLSAPTPCPLDNYLGF